MPLAQVTSLVKELKATTESVGRNPNTLRIVSRGSFRVHATPQGKRRRPLWGTLEEIREDIDRYRNAGLTELFLDPNFGHADTVFDQDSNSVLQHVLEIMTSLSPTQ